MFNQINALNSKIFDANYVTTEVPAGSDYDMWRLRALSLEEFNQLSSNFENIDFEQLAYLSSWGILAPSTHNTVPVRFRFQPDNSRISLYIDRKFVLPHSDVNGRQAVISIGCAYANIELSAANFGYVVDSQYSKGLDSKITHTDVEEDRYLHIVDMEIRKGGRPVIPQVLQHMLTRKVVRSEYDDSFKVDNVVMTAIKEHIKKRFPSVELTIITDRHELHTIAKFQEDADRTVFEDDNFILELGNWLHPNSKEKVTIGMRGKEFGFDDMFSHKMHKGLLREERIAADQIAGFARGGRVAIDSSSAVFVFSIGNDIPKEQIEVGRAYQEVALLLHANNIYHSIHAGIVEVNWINRIVATTLLHTKMRPSVVLRAGVPKREEDKYRPHSGRPDFASLLL